jgi:phosphoribosylformylglycinamidine cyclo-ligase
MSLYQKRGVSAQKEEVHAAIRHLDAGLYPHAFCKMYPDKIGGDDQFVNIMHADGAGTKSILAYLYWKETGDISVWKGIAQDAIAMNLDDLLCTGVYTNLLFSSTIDRNKNRIPGIVLEQIINGTQAFFDEMKVYGVEISFLGGETADVGDLVRTIAVNGTMMARWPKKRIITNEKIGPGQVLVGFSSAGRTIYEYAYNSGLGSNGLTSARHDMLSNYYAEAFPETYEPDLEPEVVYIGKNKLTDPTTVQYLDVNNQVQEEEMSVGQLLLSPTRTYAPLLKLLLEEYFDDLYGIIHCSGGGQTKCLKYLPRPLRIVKNNLLPVPPVFDQIRQNSGANHREMMQVFNMGHRLEIFTNETTAASLIAVANRLGISAQIIGHTEKADRAALHLLHRGEEIVFT